MHARPTRAFIVSSFLIAAGLVGPTAHATPPVTLPATTAEEPAPNSVLDGLDIDAGAFGADGAASDAASTTPRGIADDVRDAVERDGTARVIVRLREQVDIEGVAEQARRAGAAAAQELRATNRSANKAQAAQAAKAARTETVVTELQDLADQTQPGIVDLVTAGRKAADVKQFWIFNGLAATVDASTLDALASRPDVYSVTLDREITLPETSDEPNLPTWSLEKVNAPDVWGEYGVRGEGVVVGIMDGGVDVTHPALKESWRGADGDVESSWFVPTGEPYDTPGDGSGHGTHVAGSIVGQAPGELTGVAPEAEWIAAKIFRDSGTTSDSIIHAAFEWMMAPGGDPAKAPDVVNNSWGSPDGTRTEFWDDVDAWIAAGIVPIFANGNDGPAPGTVGSPGSYPHTIGVGATDSNDFIADFSSRGPASWDGEPIHKPQVSAPGEAIRSTWPLHLDADGYNTISGTSMAAPHATGVVALMLSADPTLTVDDVRTILENTARVEPHMGTTPNNTYGNGIVDAFAAVTNVAHSGTLTGTVSGPDGPIEATVTVDGAETSTDADTGGYELAVAEGTHDVTISAYGYVSATDAVTVTTGGTVKLDVTLQPASVHTLSGTITSNGAPVDNARVSAPDTPVDPTRTAADGTFALDIAAGTHTVRVDAAGHAPSQSEVTVDSDTSVDIALEPLATPTDTGWRQYQNNARRTGLASESLAADSLQRAWTADVDSQLLFTSPVISGEHVYVGGDDGRLVALDVKTGEQQWAFQASPGLRGTPAIADGRVFIGGGQDGGIYALDAATGEVAWQVETPGRVAIYSAPSVVDGVVYVQTGPSTDREDTVFALDAQSGEQLWATDVGTSVFTPPAVADGQVVVANADDAELMSLDTETGAVSWTTTRDNDYFIGGPSLVSGTIYITTTDGDGGGSLLAVDAATGALRWENPTHGDGQGTVPAVYGDLLIAGSHGNGFTAAYDRSTGEPVWHHSIDGAVSASALVSDDGYVVVGTQLDNRLLALDAATGEVAWDEPVSRNATSSAALADGLLVTADSSGDVHAFHPTGVVRGTITGPDGPIDATVRVVETGAEASVTDGAFELTHRSGAFTLVISHYGLKRVEQAIDIRPGSEQTVDITLEPAGTGAISGLVTDDSGQPLSGATVTLGDAPIPVATTGADGQFNLSEVAEGSYRLGVELSGYVPTATDVVVKPGETAEVDVVLTPYDIAVVGDYESRITTVLEGLGYTVREASYAQAAAHADQYEVIVANGTSGSDPGAQTFLEFVAATDNAGTSVVWLDQWGISYGGIDHLNTYLGDPASVLSSSRHPGRVSVIPTVEHPLTDGLPVGERAQILQPNDWSAFDDYSGVTVAQLHTDDDGIVGDAIAYQPRGLDSAHVLLGSLAAAASWGNPEQTWAPAATTVLENAVQYAADAAYGQVSGTVTDDAGAPLSASVRVVGSDQVVTTTADGGYELTLEPGEYTLRFSLLGYGTVEKAVTIAAGGSVELDAALADAGVGTISGTVAAGGSPVGGAEVAVAGLTTVTGADGSFVLADVPGGTHKLVVSADGHLSESTSVEVSAGQETVADVVLEPAPRVGVMDDYARDGVTAVLDAAEFSVEPVDWSDVARVGAFDVIVFNDPSDPGEAVFTEFLSAMDAAEVSGVFPDDRFSGNGGARLLREYLGDPGGHTSVTDEGFVSYDAVAPDHPLFAGLDGQVEVLRADRDATTIDDYSGLTLANLSTEGDTTGVAAAYTPRTPGSVHLLLSGLSAHSLQSPGDDWTRDGERLYVNAVKWASQPAMGGVEGVVTAQGGPALAATVEVVGTKLTTSADADGSYQLALPPGDHTLRFSYFGYTAAEVGISVVAGEVSQQDAQLAPDESAVSVKGTVTSDGSPVPDARVALLGTPLATTTDTDGSYNFDHVISGDFHLDVSATGFIRSRSAVSISDGDVVADVTLNPTAAVGVVGDYQDHMAGYLSYWGYTPQQIDWTATRAEIGQLALVVANLGASNDPGRAGFAAFQDAVNRAGVSAVWLDQYGRGSFQYLERYEGDPATLGQGRTDGAVTATVTNADHPLTAGLPSSFPLVAEDEEYSWFDDFSGTTVATVASDDEPGGALAGFRARGARSVDVLLGTLSVSTYGYPDYGPTPARSWTPEAERLLRNALGYALDAPHLNAEVHGVVTDESGIAVPGEVTVAETGKTHPVAADGTFVTPLAPGDWTLEVREFGFETFEAPVSVAAGDIVDLDVALSARPTGSVSGVVSGPGGDAIAGATVSIVGTALSSTTAADGSFTIADIPADDWTLRVAADGFQAAEQAVTVPAGAAVTADVSLIASLPLAVVGDYRDSVADLLASDGYTVTQFSYSSLDELTSQLDVFELVIFNGTVSSSLRDEFAAAVESIEESQTSTIYGGQWGGYALGALSEVRGDPKDVDYDFVPNGIDYVPTTENPIFAGYEVGEPIPLITDEGANQQWLAFSEYTGQSLANVAARDDGEDLGTAVGYRFTSLSSVEILLGSLSAAGYGSPGDDWTSDAERIYLNAVGWAVEARAATITGVVSSAGEPISGATVTAVESGVTTTTGDDGSYTVGVAGGDHTIEVAAPGFEPSSRTVTVEAGGQATVDIELVPLPRGNVAGTITAAGGEPVEGASVVATGPQEWDATTGSSGEFTANDVLAGDYAVTITADGYLPVTSSLTVLSNGLTRLDAELRPIDVGVLGDVDGVVTTFLRSNDVAAGTLPWDADIDLSGYDVVIVNGGEPSAATFGSVMDAADAAEVSVIFTGTWGVDRGGVRLLEKYTSRVTVGAHGYGDGPVTLEAFDVGHPLFADIGDPSELIVDGGYYSVLSSYAGAPLAQLAVAREPGDDVTGLAAGYSWRTPGSLELVLSASAVTDAVGPGQGWTPAAGRLLVNAVEWTRAAELQAPQEPEFELPAPGVTFDGTVDISGVTTWPASVTVFRDGTKVATAEADIDGSWTANVPLDVGTNTLTAVASNAAGESSEPLAVDMDRWQPEWQVAAEGTSIPVLLRFTGATMLPEPADEVTLVVTNETGDELVRQRMRWVVYGYMTLLRKLPADASTLTAEVVIDGVTLTTSHPL